MARFVYAVLFADDNNILIAQKYERGYYFGPATILPQGTPLNGGGNFAFPGGRLGAQETIVAGSTREFVEETNVLLQNPVNYTDFPLRQSGNHYFGAGLYQVTAQDLAQIATAAKNNLDEGYEAQQGIRFGVINAYNQIAANYPNAPADNELTHVALQDLGDPQVRQTIAGWQNDPQLGWFYFFVQRVCQLLGLPPLLAADEPAALASDR